MYQLQAKVAAKSRINTATNADKTSRIKCFFHGLNAKMTTLLFILGSLIFISIFSF